MILCTILKVLCKLAKDHTVAIVRLDSQTKCHVWAPNGRKERGAISHPRARVNEKLRREVTRRATDTFRVWWIELRRVLMRESSDYSSPSSTQCPKCCPSINTHTHMLTTAATLFMSCSVLKPWHPVQASLHTNCATSLSRKLNEAEWMEAVIKWAARPWGGESTAAGRGGLADPEQELSA